MAASLAFAALAILPGYLAFRTPPEVTAFSIPEAIVNLTIGLGWLPTLLFPLNPGMAWYVLFFFLQYIGVWDLLKTHQPRLIALVGSAGVQVGLVVLANLAAQYAFRGRQLLFLIPPLSLLAAVGLARIIRQAQIGVRHPQVDHDPAEKPSFPLTAFAAVSLGILLLVGAFGMLGYYQEIRSDRRTLTEHIIQQWQPGDRIWTTPAWEAKYYGYYLGLLGHAEIQPALAGADEIRLAPDQARPICWITPLAVSKANQDLLAMNGYHQVAAEQRTVPDLQSLWCQP
jgi:hypothetical protein